jgi:hypothetical protein
MRMTGVTMTKKKGKTMTKAKKKNERAPGDFRHPKRLTVDTVLPLRGTLLDRTHSPAGVDVRHAEGRVERAVCGGVGV